MLKIDLSADLSNIVDLANGKYRLMIDPLNNQKVYIGQILRIGSQLENELFQIEEIVINKFEYYLLLSIIY